MRAARFSQPCRKPGADSLDMRFRTELDRRKIWSVLTIAVSLIAIVAVGFVVAGLTS